MYETAPGPWSLIPAFAPNMLTSDLVTSDLNHLFEQEYRLLRPRAPIPPIAVRFRRFTSLNTTIRLREGKIFVSLSDLIEGAPENVIRAIAHILLAKLYKKPINPAHNLRFKRFTTSAAVARQTELIRHARGTKRYTGPQGYYYNLEEVFDSLNSRFFGGLLGRPDLTWSESMARRSLGHYDAAHNTIVVSRVFDRPSSRATPSNIFSTTRCCTSGIRSKCAVCVAASTPANSKPTRRVFRNCRRPWRS